MRKYGTGSFFRRGLKNPLETNVKTLTLLTVHLVSFGQSNISIKARSHAEMVMEFS